jgi:PAS domain S-box-containing protein
MKPTMADFSEAERLAVLHGLEILDTPSDPALDALVNLAAQTFGTSSAAITLVDQDRQWFKERVGLSATETSRDVAFCDHTIRRDSVTVVADAASDPRFVGNDLVTGAPHIRFYAGAPLTVAGARIGALCVIDTAPRAAFDDAAQATLAAMATAVNASLELRREVQLRRAMSRDLQEQRRKLALAESMAGVGHWSVDLKTETIFWSDEVYRIHGVSRETYQPTLNSAIAFYVPEDRAKVTEVVIKAAAHGGTYGFRLRLVRVSDQAVRVVSCTAEAALGPDDTAEQIFGVFQDVTEQEGMMAALRAGEARYRLLAENANDMVATMAPDSTVTFITPAVGQVLGYTPEEIVGKRTLDLTHEDDIGLARSVFKNLIAAGPGAAPPTYQFRARHKNGGFVWLEGQPRVEFDADGKPTCFQDVVRDITGRKHLEDELRAAMLAAEAAAQAKSDFIANVTHELRTPLNSIIGFSGLLARDNTLGAPQARFARLIDGASRRLLGIVNDVLDLSKIEAGGLSLETAPVDLVPLATETLDMLRPQADAKHLKLQIALPDAPVIVLADAGRVRQILLNLLGNAIKFTESGAVRLALRATASPTGLAVQMAISDTGIGIPADRIVAMFQRFEQADGSIARRFGGTGLGLSICQALTAQMGGSIDVASEEDSGSCFTVKLDLPAATLVPHQAAASPGVGGTLAGLRLLVAEDMVLNQELIGLFLNPCGISIDFVDNGVQAVAAAEAMRYDVILMDMRMPVMDGLEAARRIRAGDGACAGVPIIALSANVLAPEIEQALQAGMDDHIGKPFDAAGLIQTLARWRGGRAGAASNADQATRMRA